MFGNPEVTTGGRALKFYSSVRMDVRRIESLKQGGEVIGNRVRIKVVKNKIAPPFREAEFDIMFGKGISREGDILDLAAKENIVEKSGAWYAYEGSKIGQGRENAKNFLAANPEICLEIENKVRVKYGLSEDTMMPEASKEAPTELPPVGVDPEERKIEQNPVTGHICVNSNRKSYSWQRVNCSYEKGLYMRIERVESLDKRKCKVFTDEDFAFLLYNGELEKYGVCEGAVLEERTERELLDLLSRRAHERALNLLKVQDRTEGEMCRRLFQDGYPDSIVQETIGFLQEYHFVDDARYAANYLQVHGKRKSQAELKLYLQRKGISREIIREQLEETEHDSGEAIRVLLEKKHYRAGETAPEEEKKIIAYLMRRGFSWEDIRREMKKPEDALS